MPEAWGYSDHNIEHAFGLTVYGTLRNLASAHLRKERTGHTLRPTALVHEAWIRLEEDAVAQCAEQEHFFALASQAMRRILVDHARAQGADKRGGNWKRVTLSLDPATEEAPVIDVIALHEALDSLNAASPRQAKVVELRFFGGLSIEEVAGVLKLSISTVVREWRVAQAWLLARLADPEPAPKKHL
ncbi:MAG: ECF-type sigma factor [Planctomycetota bacterium]|nr:ECF-type sigma factor [Planctomycetota bacterium]